MTQPTIPPDMKPWTGGDSATALPGRPRAERLKHARYAIIAAKGALKRGDVPSFAVLDNLRIALDTLSHLPTSRIAVQDLAQIIYQYAPVIENGKALSWAEVSNLKAGYGGTVEAANETAARIVEMIEEGGRA